MLAVLLLAADTRVASGGELETSGGASRFDGELPVELAGFVDMGANSANGKFWW